MRPYHRVICAAAGRNGVHRCCGSTAAGSQCATVSGLSASSRNGDECWTLTASLNVARSSLDRAVHNSESTPLHSTVTLICFSQTFAPVQPADGCGARTPELGAGSGRSPTETERQTKVEPAGRKARASSVGENAGLHRSWQPWFDFDRKGRATGDRLLSYFPDVFKHF